MSRSNHHVNAYDHHRFFPSETWSGTNTYGTGMSGTHTHGSTALSEANASFYSGSYTWTISGQLLQDILDAKTGERFSSELFEIANLKCQIKLCPNGNKEQFNGYCRIFIKIVSMPSQWKTITICRTIDSPQTQSRETRIARCGVGDAKGWVYPLPFSEIENGNFKKLEFCVFIKILRVTLASGEGHYQCHFGYNKTQQLSYKLDAKLLDKLKTCRPGKMVESGTFGNMWTVQICPNGDIPEYAGKCMVVLNLCGLPQGVGKFKVEWNIQCKEMNANISSTADFSIESTGKFCNIGRFADFKQLDSFSVNIHVFILTVYNNNGEVISNGINNGGHSISETSVNDAEMKMNEVAPAAHHENVIGSGGNEEDFERFAMKIRSFQHYIDDKLNVHDAKFAVIKTDIEGMYGTLNELMEMNKRKEAEMKALHEQMAVLMEERDHSMIETNGHTSSHRPYSAKYHKGRATKSHKKLIAFLSNQEMQLTQYFDLLMANGFESVQSLYGITHEDLKQIGIEKLGHRKQIIRCVEMEQEAHRKQLMKLIKSKVAPTS